MPLHIPFYPQPYPVVMPVIQQSVYMMGPPNLAYIQPHYGQYPAASMSIQQQHTESKRERVERLLGKFKRIECYGTRELRFYQWYLSVYEQYLANGRLQGDGVASKVQNFRTSQDGYSTLKKELLKEIGIL